jgi:hypothetical protein
MNATRWELSAAVDSEAQGEREEEERRGGRPGRADAGRAEVAAAARARGVELGRFQQQAESEAATRLG